MAKIHKGTFNKYVTVGGWGVSAKIVTKRYEKIGGRGVYGGFCYVTVEKKLYEQFSHFD